MVLCSSEVLVRRRCSMYSGHAGYSSTCIAKTALGTVPFSRLLKTKSPVSNVSAESDSGMVPERRFSLSVLRHETRGRLPTHARLRGTAQKAAVGSCTHRAESFVSVESSAGMDPVSRLPPRYAIWSSARTEND